MRPQRAYEPLVQAIVDVHADVHVVTKVEALQVACVRRRVEYNEITSSKLLGRRAVVAQLRRPARRVRANATHRRSPDHPGARQVPEGLPEPLQLRLCQRGFQVMAEVEHHDRRPQQREQFADHLKRRHSPLRGPPSVHAALALRVSRPPGAFHGHPAPQL